MEPAATPAEDKGHEDIVDEMQSRDASFDWSASDEKSSVRRSRYIVWVGLFVLSVIAAAVMWWLKGVQEQAAIDSYRMFDQLSNSLTSAERDVSDIQLQMSDNIYPPPAPVMNALSQRLRDAVGRVTELRNQQAALPPSARAQSDAAATKIVDDRWTAVWFIYAAIVACSTLAAAIYLRYLQFEKRRQFENKRLVEQIAEQNLSDEFDLQNLWESNKKQLQLYHQLVVNYAQSSRQSTQVFLICGFFFIVLVGVFALTRSSTAGAISSSIVSATGAIVTGFIAQTALKNQDSSSRELVEFFAHPLDVQRALAAERLIVSMPVGDQSRAKLIVVEHLAAAINQRTRRASEAKPVSESD